MPDKRSSGTMLGRKGWHGQCACCCGKDSKCQERRREEREWLREAEDDTTDV